MSMQDFEAQFDTFHLHHFETVGGIEYCVYECDIHPGTLFDENQDGCPKCEEECWKAITCETCGGSGYFPDQDVLDDHPGMKIANCPACGGTGYKKESLGQ